MALDIKLSIILSILSSSQAKIISSLSVSKIIFLFFSLAYNTVDITISSKTLTILQFTKFNLSESLFTFVISITLLTNLNNLYEFCFNMFKYSLYFSSPNGLLCKFNNCTIASIILIGVLNS